MSTEEHKHTQPARTDKTHDDMIKRSEISPSGCASAVLWPFRHWRLTVFVAVLGLIAFIIWQIRSMTEGGESLLEVKHTETIMQTPEEVRALRDIGQWEFMAVNTEELIERHEAHTLGDKHLVKVYRGTLRIGIDMKQATDEWFALDSIASPEGKQNVRLVLPDVALLDTAFIDEARTTTFYEDGRFDAKAKQAMYNDAVKAMKARALTEDNLTTARKSAEEQFTHIFQALGYGDVAITFAEKN